MISWFRHRRKVPFKKPEGLYGQVYRRWSERVECTQNLSLLMLVDALAYHGLLEGLFTSDAGQCIASVPFASKETLCNPCLALVSPPALPCV